MRILKFDSLLFSLKKFCLLGCGLRFGMDETKIGIILNSFDEEIVIAYVDDVRELVRSGLSNSVIPNFKRSQRTRWPQLLLPEM